MHSFGHLDANQLNWSIMKRRFDSLKTEIHSSTSNPTKTCIKYILKHLSLNRSWILSAPTDVILQMRAQIRHALTEKRELPAKCILSTLCPQVERGFFLKPYTHTANFNDAFFHADTPSSFHLQNALHSENLHLKSDLFTSQNCLSSRCKVSRSLFGKHHLIPCFLTSMYLPYALYSSTGLVPPKVFIF